MTTLRARIDADLKNAMLTKNEAARDALRLAKSELLLKEVELGRALTDEETVAILQKSVKARKDAISDFQAAGRLDLVTKEELELTFITPYLPKTLDATETRAAIQAIATELGLTSKKDMGRLMKELKARHAAVDGRLASQLAGDILN
jgi:uncharacterized protein YqeY